MWLFSLSFLVSLQVLMFGGCGRAARAGGQGRGVAARDDKRSKKARCLALCSGLNSVGAEAEPRDPLLSEHRLRLF